MGAVVRHLQCSFGVNAGRYCCSLNPTHRAACKSKGRMRCKQPYTTGSASVNSFTQLHTALSSFQQRASALRSSAFSCFKPLTSTVSMLKQLL
eukprot:10790887-Alexandrium_andersonii.AAC.1